jgi:hypothetical protein
MRYLLWIPDGHGAGEWLALFWMNILDSRSLSDNPSASYYTH